MAVLCCKQKMSDLMYKYLEDKHGTYEWKMECLDRVYLRFIHVYLC